MSSYYGREATQFTIWSSAAAVAEELRVKGCAGLQQAELQLEVVPRPIFLGLFYDGDGLQELLAHIRTIGPSWAKHGLKDGKGMKIYRMMRELLHTTRKCLFDQLV